VGKPFIIPVNLAKKFSEEESNIIKKYGAVFHRLTHGERQPETEAQKRFVEVARGKAFPIPMTKYERVWCKYLVLSLEHCNRNPRPSRGVPVSRPSRGVPVFRSRSPRLNEMKFSTKETKPKISHKSNITNILNPNNGPWKRMAWNWKKTK